VVRENWRGAGSPNVECGASGKGGGGQDGKKRTFPRTIGIRQNYKKKRRECYVARRSAGEKGEGWEGQSLFFRQTKKGGAYSRDTAQRRGFGSSGKRDGAVKFKKGRRLGAAAKKVRTIDAGH